MSETAPETTITVEDLKHKALQIRDLAESEVRTMVEDRGARLVAVAVVGVLVAVSIAYYFGTRRRY